MIRIGLLVFAIVVFILLIVGAIDHDTSKWAYAAFATWAASFLPWEGGWPNWRRDG